MSYILSLMGFEGEKKMYHEYILNYFPLTGMAESCRLAFHLVGVPFTDNLIPFAEWPKYKSDVNICPLGQLPTLQIDGVAMCQHLAIVRYLAHQFDLYGGDSMEKAICDQVIETAHEIFQGLENIIMNQPIDAQPKAFADFFASDSEKLKINFLSSILKRNNGDYFLGSKISMADLYYYAASEYIIGCFPSTLNKYIELRTLREKIGEVEPLKKYLSTRKVKVFMDPNIGEHY